MKQTKRRILNNLKKKKIKHFFDFTLFLFILVPSLFAGIYFYKVFAIPLPETPANEMHQIPQDVKGTMIQHSHETSYRIPILMYHYVEYVKNARDHIRQTLNIIPPIFAQQIQTLEGAGYTFMNMSEVADVLDGNKVLPKKPIVLTFDDGYRDFYTDVLPIIKQYNVKVVAYIVPGFNNLPNNMDTWQIHQLEQSGLVEIGAHTVHHVSLKDAQSATVAYEVEESKRMLENELHIPIVSFAYPYGAFDQQVINIVKAAGFRTATSTIPGVEASDVNRFFLFRIRPGDQVGVDLLNFLDKNSYSVN